MNGDRVNWLKMQWLRFDKAHLWEMQYKYSYSEVEPWKMVSFKRGRGRRSELQHAQLTQLYPEPRQITTAKFNDLMQLLCYIPPVYHGFYHSLKVAENVQQEAEDGEFSGYESE